MTWRILAASTIVFVSLWPTFSSCEAPNLGEGPEVQRQRSNSERSWGILAKTAMAKIVKICLDAARN